MSAPPFELDTPIGELLTVLSDIAGYLQRIADTLDPPRSKPNGKILPGTCSEGTGAPLTPQEGLGVHARGFGYFGV
jgi:hypothetical protein